MTNTPLSKYARAMGASAAGFCGSGLGYLPSPLPAGWLADTAGRSGMSGCMAAFPLPAMGIWLLFRPRFPAETAAQNLCRLHRYRGKMGAC